MRQGRWGWLAALLLTIGCDESNHPSQTIHMLRSSLDKAAGGVVVELDLSHGLSEKPSHFSLLSGTGAPTYADLVQTVARASKDRRTRGFLLRLGESDLSWAQTEELGRLLGALKPEQPVVCHAHAYSNATLSFALTACDRVWLSPAGEVASVGIAGQMLYLKRLLDRFKVKADFLHMGRYKSAAETLTEDGPSVPARESLDAVLGSLRQTWIDSLNASHAGVAMHEGGREIQKFAEYGPWAPEAAVQAGLVDAVGYLSEARDDAKGRAGVDEVETSFGLQARRDAGDELEQLLRFIAGTSKSDHGGDQVAVLATAGGISMTGGGAVGGDGIAADSLTKTLRRLRDNESVKAVVLRIDSPGGSALASDLLWHELMLLREKKPLIASLAGTAASGGYYLACAATRILAERTSIIGSIGVVGGKIVFGESLNDFGVTSVTFPANKEPGAGTRAAYLSPLTPWDDPTRESVRAQMAAIYELFLRRVSQGRDMPVDDVRKIAEGRIWSGAQGMEIKLIDGFGGLTEAIAWAKKQAGLDENAEVKIEGGSEGLLDMLGIAPDSDESSMRAALARVRTAAPGPFDSLTEPLRPYATSLAPLLGREHVLTAMPFAIEIR
ncbi:MAG: S49 family peptidase [Deltaproteobacteria bacterium]